MNHDDGAGPAISHLLDIESLQRVQIESLLESAAAFARANRARLKSPGPLHGKTVVNLFYEPSTRTRISFELAAKRLGADVVNVETAASSVSKGESLQDTVLTLQAMRTDVLVMRHPDEGSSAFVANHPDTELQVINAGDGTHAHPTQGLLDAFTIVSHRPNLESLRVMIAGDIKHSRVARSDIEILSKLGVGEICLAAPQVLLPDNVAELPVSVAYDLETGLADADVVIMLRIQHERIQGLQLPDGDSYFQRWGLNPARLQIARPDCLVMHPGPMNRGVEIDASVAEGPQSLINQQVANGVFMRMAVLDRLIRDRHG